MFLSTRNCRDLIQKGLNFLFFKKNIQRYTNFIVRKPVIKVLYITNVEIVKNYIFQ